MPLTIIIEEEGTKPAFICDECGKEITDAFDANYEWNEPDDETRITDIKFLHKDCSRAYEIKHGRSDCNMGIHNLMVYLLNNTHLHKEELEAAYANSASLNQM